MGGEATDQHQCNSGPACKGHDGRQPCQTRDPLCHACLDAAGREIRNLVFDYLDLAQLHEASLSQAVGDGSPGGSGESPMLIAGHVEALQAEIVHVTALWEHALRAVHRLSDPRTFRPTWNVHVYDHLDLVAHRPTLRKARPGAIVQRAIGIIAPRLTRLAALDPITVCPTGIEDQPTLMAGWEAVHHLQHLHTRARSMLGRTVRKFWLPGDCWTCGHDVTQARRKRAEDGPLYRSEPRYEGDPMQVNCDHCGGYRPYADFEYALAHLGMWPDQASDQLVRVSA